MKSHVYIIFKQVFSRLLFHFGPTQLLLKKNSDNGIEGFLVGCIPSIIDEKISTLSKVATSTKQDPLGFIGGLSLSHQYKLVGQTLKKNSF